MQVKYLKKCSGNANEIGQLNEAFGHPRLNPRERKDHPSSSPLTQTSSEKCNEDFKRQNINAVNTLEYKK